MGAAVDDLGRDAVIADLMIHGWSLVFRVRRGDILVLLNEKGAGFSFHVQGTTVTLKPVTDGRWDDDVDAEWGELTDEMLDAFMLLRAGRHTKRVSRGAVMRIKEFKDWQ